MTVSWRAVAESHVAYVVTGINRRREELDRLVYQAGFAPLIHRITQLLRENANLFFWASASMCLFCAPTFFLVGSALGVATANFQGQSTIRTKHIHKLDWSSTKHLIAVIALIMSRYLGFFIHGLTGGYSMGFHLVRVCNGRAGESDLRGLAALEDEVGLVSEELAAWLPYFHRTKFKRRLLVN